MANASEPDYLHPDGKPDETQSPEELTDKEKFSDSSKNKAIDEADGHSLKRKDAFLGTEEQPDPAERQA